MFKAQGYAATGYTVHPYDSTRVANIALQQNAFLTLRVTPAASQIWLDGRNVATGVLNRFPTKAGPHMIEVKYIRGGQVLGRNGPKRITLEPGKELRLAPIILNVRAQEEKGRKE